MKTVTKSLSALMIMILFLSITISLHAQGRGNGMDKTDYTFRNTNPGHGHIKNPRGDRDKHMDKRKPSNVDHLKIEHRYRHTTYRHHRHNHPSWAPSFGYRYNTRYIYYQDHNVYYDCHRDVFLVWTGRRWSVSSHLPARMLHVNFRNTRVKGVDYWEDDFDFYLQRRRPSYLSISANW